MKIMYVASRGPLETDLELTREITELQRRFADQRGERVQFRILPDTRIDELFGQLSTFGPDILHISSHAEEDRLSLKDPSGKSIAVSAQSLTTLLPPRNLPLRLVYLNSCDSMQIASELVLLGATSFAIGSTAPVTTLAARNGVVAFYERILGGYTLQDAYAACKSTVELSSAPKASAELFQSIQDSASTTILHTVPRIIADFVGLKPRIGVASAGLPFSRDADGDLHVKLGLVGCPISTRQVVFFTDDEQMVDDLWTVLQQAPKNGVVWPGDDEEAWWVNADLRIFAAVVLTDGSSFILASTLCEAIQSRYRSYSKEMPALVSAALNWLRSESDPIGQPIVNVSDDRVSATSAKNLRQGETRSAKSQRRKKKSAKRPTGTKKKKLI